MTFRVRGDNRATRDCRLCGRPLMAHAVTEFCKDGLTRSTDYVSPERRLWEDYQRRRLTERDLMLPQPRGGTDR